MKSVTTIERPDTTEIEAEHAPIVAEANALVIVDAASHGAAIQLGNRATARKAVIEGMLKPATDAAHKAHRELTSLRSTLCAPFDRVREICGGKALEWERKARAAAAEEQRKREEAARKAEEERQLQDAMAAEAAGDTEQAEQILAEAPAAPVIPVAPDIAKVEGSSSRGNWKAEVVDFAAFLKHCATHEECHGYVAAVMPVLNALARSQRDLLRIPGVRAVREESMAFSKR